VKFDPTINLGHLITLGGLMIAGLLGYMNLVRRIDRIEANLDLVFTWFEENVIGSGAFRSKTRHRRPNMVEDGGSGHSPDFYSQD
jgi:hypothetical protein